MAKHFHMGNYYDDYAPGDTMETMRRTVTTTDIINFVGLGGFFEEIFLCDQAEVAVYGRRVAPGLLTFTVSEGLLVSMGIFHRTGMAVLEFSDVQFKAPVGDGDTVHHELEVTEMRPSKKPDRGVVSFAHKLINQKGEAVITYTSKRMLRRREEA